MSTQPATYPVYKGLQKPLMFKGFKGKYIYIGFGCIAGGLVACIAVSMIASFLWGGITLVAVMGAGLFITARGQRKGLHNKDKRRGIFIVQRVFSREG